MKLSRPLIAGLVFGYAFLFIPVLLLVLTSFNDSRMTTVLSGFSFRWYGVLWNNDKLIAAGVLSLQIAAISATGATVIGTAAGVMLARVQRLPGRGLLSALLATRLLLPDVLIGLSLLLLFVASEQAIGIPTSRGALTIAVAHISFSLSYVAVVVRARLEGSGIDLEEAAQDLGATPAGAFLRITLPLLAPALLSGWLLAFTLSLDDLVVASFVSGPGASTLPMVVFSSLRLGATPELNALATIILVGVSVALIGAWALQQRSIASGRRRSSVAAQGRQA
jgi:putrescine transport system permease protein